MENAFPGTDWGRALGDLSDAIVSGRPHRATGAHAAHIVEILDATATSVAEGRAVEITSSFASPELGPTTAHSDLGSRRWRRASSGAAGSRSRGSSSAAATSAASARRRRSSGRGSRSEEALADHGRRLGARHHDVRHRGRVRRRAQRDLDRRVARDEGRRPSATRSSIETKTFNPMDAGADHGLSRRRIRRQIETSLERLGVERVPLYMAHAFDAGHAAGGDARGVRRARSRGQGRRGRRVELRRRAARRGGRDLGARGADALRVGAELVLAPRARATPRRSSRSATSTGSGYEAFGPLAGGWLAGKYRRGERVSRRARA